MIKKIEKLFVESGDDGEAEFITMISDGEDKFEFLPDENKDIPILALRNVVLFPEVVLPVSLGRKKSLMAIRSAYKKGTLVGVFTQKRASEEDPSREDLYSVGCHFIIPPLHISCLFPDFCIKSQSTLI